jgi:hypothetical protein
MSEHAQKAAFLHAAAPSARAHIAPLIFAVVTDDAPPPSVEH